MSTTTKTFSVGDKVRWRVDEECPYRCPECGMNFHFSLHALTQQGMVTHIIAGYRTMRCDFQGLDSPGCQAKFPFLASHAYFVAFPNDNIENGSEGGYFTADELELI